MEDVRDFFREIDSVFTIYVVEQRFVVGRGADYFRSYKGKINYIDSDKEIKNRIGKILQKINKHIPNTAELVQSCFSYSSPLGLLEIVSALSKLFSVTEHQAAGPEVIDPIIIQEGKILPKYINQIISLHKESILRPAIIVLLKDNDFERAKSILSGSPHNTQIKMIRNSGETEMYRVINCGSDNIHDFLEAFSMQCFNTCSNTKREILYNKYWANDSVIRLYSPSIMQLRTSMLFRDKTLIRKDLDFLINNINKAEPETEHERKLLAAFECILHLFRVFCNDGGVQDMNTALSLAKTLDNNILLAHVYRNAYFLGDLSMKEKIKLMEKASSIFSENGMEDYAIYAKNNSLVRQFDMESISVYDFLELQEQAIYNVPGLVGMSHILNNTGAALLTSGHPDSAIEYFDKALNYAYRPERSIQKIAIMSNKAITKAYCAEYINESELYKIMNLIFDNREVLNLPFLSARYALNVVAVGYSQSPIIGDELMTKYPVKNLIESSISDNELGSGQLILQLQVLADKYNRPDLVTISCQPKHILEAKGIRKNFIVKNTFNPCSFSTWF